MIEPKISPIQNVPVTGPIRLFAGKGGATLYMAKSGSPPSNVHYEFATILTPLSVTDGDKPAINGPNSSMPTITIPQPLPPPPAWDLCATADGTINVAYQVFGGGWNIVQVGAVKSGSVENQYGYGVNDCGAPHFLRDLKGNAPSTALASTILDSRQLGLLVPQAPDKDGTIRTEFVGIVDSSSGVVFGDSTSGSPQTVTLVYKTDKATGPLSSTGLFLGQINLADYNLPRKQIGKTLPIIKDYEIYEFDAAALGGNYFMLAGTGAVPQMIFFNDKGSIEQVNWPEPWPSASRWIASPTVLAVPATPAPVTSSGAQGSNPLPGAAAFLFAFIEMDGDQPMGIRVGTIEAR